jgi:hypothetical protein
MDYPLVDLASPTKLALEWGWLLVTRANFAVYVLLLVVFVLGITLRLPGARRDVERVAAERPRGGGSDERR